MNKVYIGHSCDNDIRYVSSSGGIISSMVKNLFQTGYIGTYLSCYFNQAACRYEPKLIYTYDDYELVGSVYQDMDIVGFLKSHLSEIKGRLMVTCSPCLVKVIRHLAKQANIETFIASYFCSGQTTIEGTYFYYKALGIEKSNVRNLRYRGNGWPNGIEITTSDGSIIKKPNYTEPWKTIHQSRLFTPRRCFLCKQVESIFADVSVGDPWLKEYMETDKTGNSIFIVHTELGQNVINQMLSDNVIDCNSVDYNLYEDSQKPSLLRKGNIKNDKEFIEFELRLRDRAVVYKWATKNYSNMRKYLWILGHLIRPYFNAKKMNLKMILTKVIGKIINKLKVGGKMVLEK